MLACINASESAVARRLRTTVARWCSQLVARQLDGLFGEPRVGARPTISDAQVDAIIVKRLQTTPPAESYWATRSTAKTAS